MKQEMLAMILAGGQGSRLGVFTKRIAKPAVSFGGKYRIIDFVLSNCSNSGIYTVGVLTQYKPLELKIIHQWSKLLIYYIKTIPLMQWYQLVLLELY